MSAHRPFRVVAGIFDTLHGFSLVYLVRLGEFADALFVNICNLRKPLGITRLPGAVRTSLPRIVFTFFVLSLILPHITFRHEYLPRAPQSSAGQRLFIG